jgi:hypothetical protein
MFKRLKNRVHRRDDVLALGAGQNFRSRPGNHRLGAPRILRVHCQNDGAGDGTTLQQMKQRRCQQTAAGRTASHL